jgi:hypothetical protein
LFAQSTKIPSLVPLTTLRNLQHIGLARLENGIRAGVVNASRRHSAVGNAAMVC